MWRSSTQTCRQGHTGQPIWWPKQGESSSFSHSSNEGPTQEQRSLPLNPWHVQILLVSAGLCVTSSSQQREIKPWRCLIASESLLNLSSNQEQLRHKEQSLTLAVQVFSSKLTFHNRVLVTSTLTYSWEHSWNPTQQDSIPYNSAMPAPQDS